LLANSYLHHSIDIFKAVKSKPPSILNITIMKRRIGSEAASKSKMTKRDDNSSIRCPDWMESHRLRLLSENATIRREGKSVLYWMARDQRVNDNWAMLYADWLSKDLSLPLKVFFFLNTAVPNATLRRFGFMLRGLREVESSLRGKNVAFHLVREGNEISESSPAKSINAFLSKMKPAAVITDFSPLREPTQLLSKVSDAISREKIPIFQVDAHNIVPVWFASEKQEYAARTFRLKINKLLNFLTEFPDIEIGGREIDFSLPETIDWESLIDTTEVDRSVDEIEGYIAGEEAAHSKLKEFISERLNSFGTERNNPTFNTCSGLSPYINFGQLSAQRAVLEVRKMKRYSASVASYIEEAVVRRELSDNFCFYNSKYDSLESATGWAKETLNLHGKDKREYLYTRDKLEQAMTHDDLWNASQIQMVAEGKMHGFLRMYWAKKILEWTASPEEALAVAIYLNDKYQLDGCDPNGYVGCGWSIMGIHDTAWTERPIFGKVRYMNYSGCLRKFNVFQFVSKYPKAVKNCLKVGGAPTKVKISKVKTKK